MKTAVILFYLIIGQANGFGYSSGAGGLAVLPEPYPTLEACQIAGETARANNVGLSYLSYTCVPQ